MAEQLFPYAAGRIRALEATMLTDSALRLLAEGAPQERERLLHHAGYHLERGVEAGLAAALQATYALMRSLAPGQQVFDLFLLKYDYLALKTLLKKLYAGQKPSYHGMEGTVPTAALVAAVNEGKTGALPSLMAAALEQAGAAYSRTGDIFLPAQLLDRAAFLHKKTVAAESKIPFAIRLAEAEIDLLNLKTHYRVAAMGLEDDICFFPGGSMAPRAVAASTAFAPLRAAFQAGGFAGLELACDNRLMALARNAKLKALTIEPLLAYVFAKEAEVRNLRLILGGEKERIRLSYV